MIETSRGFGFKNINADLRNGSVISSIDKWPFTYDLSTEYEVPINRVPSEAEEALLSPRQVQNTKSTSTQEDARTSTSTWVLYHSATQYASNQV